MRADRYAEIKRLIDRLPKWLTVVVFFVLLAASGLAFTISYTHVFWEKVPLDSRAMRPFQHPAGDKAYIIELPSKHMDQEIDDPCPARLIERGRFLPSPNFNHADIAGKGNARYSFYGGNLIFAPWDNSDPRQNGWLYEVYWPKFRYRVWWFIPVYLALVLWVPLMLIRLPGLRQYPIKNLRAPDLAVTGTLIGLFSLCMLFLAGTMVTDPESVPWHPVWCLGAVFGLLAGLAARRRYGRKGYWKAVLPVMLVLAACFFILTAVAKDRSTGCHNKEHTAWEGYCVSGDSSSYYTGWRPGHPSTRQPLYPWLIWLVTGGKTISWQDHTNMGHLNTDADDLLLRVSRTQIVLLLSAVLVCAATLMCVTYTLLPALLFLGFYCFGVVTGPQLNVILTEAFTQAWLWLVLAAFLAFLWRRKAWLLPLAAVLCACSYLTRQASVVTFYFLGVMLLVALWDDWKKFLKSGALALALAALLVFLPDMLVWWATGSPSSNQATLQYQYRIAYATQVATLEDLDLMPDQESRDFLEYMVDKRDIMHRRIDEHYPDTYTRMVNYTNSNLYDVATPVGAAVAHTPEFFMKVANPILKAHVWDHALYGMRFWEAAVTNPEVDRLGFHHLGVWAALLAPLGLVILIRGWSGLAAITMTAAHYSHVMIACLFSAPLPRMVFATDGLLFLGGYLLAWRVLEWLLALCCHGDAGVEPLVT